MSDAESLVSDARACADGDLPPNVALLRLAMAAARPEEVEAALRAAGAGAGREGALRIAAALALWRDNPQAFATVKGVLDGVSHGSGGEGLAGWARTFDRLAGEAPEGGVALYALGNPDLLRAATAEVVERLADWGLLGPGVRAAEIGCGIGRLVAALAPRVARVTGLDLSPGMIARARQRCAGLPNVALRVTSGRDLSALATGGTDLLLAADVVPYLVQAGGGLAATHLREAARVLAPGGHLAVLNWSYRGDLALDRREVRDLADEAGLEVRRDGTRDLALWDAAAWLLRRP